MARKKIVKKKAAKKTVARKKMVQKKASGIRKGYDIKVEYVPQKKHWLVTFARIGRTTVLASYTADSQDRAGRYIAGYLRGPTNE